MFSEREARLCQEHSADDPRHDIVGTTLRSTGNLSRTCVSVSVCGPRQRKHNQVRDAQTQPGPGCLSMTVALEQDLSFAPPRHMSA